MINYNFEALTRNPKTLSYSFLRYYFIDTYNVQSLHNLQHVYCNIKYYLIVIIIADSIITNKNKNVCSLIVRV